MTLRLKILIATLGVLLAGLVIDQMLFTDDNTVTAERPDALVNGVRLTINGTEDRLPSITALLPNIGEFDEIWRRPLFLQSRKASAISITPRTNRTASRATGIDQPPQFIIVGVAIRPGGGSVLVKKSRQEIVRVLVGDEVDGWQVDELDPKFVTMSKDGESWQIPVGEQ